MTGVVVHQCPKCELRFSFRSEMEQHMRDDHPPRATVEHEPAMAVGPAALSSAPLVTRTAPDIRRTAKRSPMRLAELLIAIAAVTVVAYGAVFVSVASAAIVATAAVVLSVMYARRRQPRLTRH